MDNTPAPLPAQPPEVNEKGGKLFVNEGALFGVVQIKATGVQVKNTVNLKGPHGGPNGGVCTPLVKHGDYYHFGVYIPNYRIEKQEKMALGNISFTIINGNQSSPDIPLVLQDLPNGTHAISVS